MATTIIDNARLQLAFARSLISDDANNSWETHADKIPGEGEVCVHAVILADKSDDDSANHIAGVTMLKIGDGVNTVGNLDWVVAPPSDMNTWSQDVLNALKAQVDEWIVDYKYITAEDLSLHTENSDVHRIYNAGKNITIDVSSDKASATINCSLVGDGTTTSISSDGKISAIDQTSAITDAEIDSIFTEVFGA